MNEVVNGWWVEEWIHVWIDELMTGWREGRLVV
jgi:hypothetical protein